MKSHRTFVSHFENSHGIIALLWYSRWLLGVLTPQEESPSCNEVWFHLTDGQGNLRDSATESRLPLHVSLLVKEKVKRWGKSPPAHMATYVAL